MFTRHPLMHLYAKKIQYELSLKLNKNVLNIRPKLQKVTLELSSINLQVSYLEDFLGILHFLTKCKPKILRSKKPVIHMKIRQNQVIGFQVVLRRFFMFDFLLKFFGLISPRYPFFQGFSCGFNQGNLSFSYNKLMFFHELDLDTEYVNNTRLFPNLKITLHTTAKTKYEALNLIRNLQMPFFKIS